MKKWEYYTGKNLSQRDLDRYGEGGWELVSVIAPSTGNFWYFFKKEITV